MNIVKSKLEGMVLHSKLLPKKGDMLFWHADLYHGGSNVIDEDQQETALLDIIVLRMQSQMPNLQIVTYTVLPTTSKHLFF